MENLARELQKVRRGLSPSADTMGSSLGQDNKRLRVSEMFPKCATIQESNHCQEDGKRLSLSVEEAQDEVRAQSAFQSPPTPS